jgi:hypothetical protein
MRTRLVFAVILLLVAVVIGCKKRNRDGTEPVEIFGLKIGGDGTIADPTLPPPPATYPDTVGGKVAKALDADAARMAKGERERGSLYNELKQLGTESPKDGRVRGIDASADRELIDAAFARWWHQVRQLPDQTYESLLHRNGLTMEERKLGTYEQGRAKGAQVFKKPYRTRITTAGDADIPGEYADVNVTAGTRAKWTGQGHLSVSGRVEFRDVLEVSPNHTPVARLEGTVGELRLTATFTLGPCYADLIGLKTGLVVVGLESALLRVGPDVAAIRYDGTGWASWHYEGVLLLRGVKEMAVPKPAKNPDHTTVLTVIRY